jgi:hypothetical protein
MILLPSITWGQTAFGLDRAIDRLVGEFEREFSQVIVEGNRVFVMQPDYNVSVNSYVIDRVYEGLISSVRESKYNLVYQPFLKDHVVRKVYSSDSAFRIEHTSFIRAQYNGMRSVLDTLDSYGVDHFLASSIQRNSNNEMLVLNVYLVETSTLLVKWAKKFYSDPKYKESKASRTFSLGVYASQPVLASVYRDYGINSSGSVVGPYDDEIIDYQGVQVSFDHSVDPRWGGGIVLGGSSIHLPNGFQDTIVGLNSMTIESLELGASAFANFWPKESSVNQFWITLKETGLIGKPSIIDTYLSSDTRVELHMTPAISLFVAMRYFGPVKRSTLTFTDGLTFNSYALCYGAYLSL